MGHVGGRVLLPKAELLVLMCLRQGTEEEGRKLGGEPAIRFSHLLGLLGIPVGQRPHGPDGLLQLSQPLRGGPSRPVGQHIVPPPGDGGWQAERGLFPAGE